MTTQEDEKWLQKSMEDLRSCAEEAIRRWPGWPSSKPARTKPRISAGITVDVLVSPVVLLDVLALVKHQQQELADRENRLEDQERSWKVTVAGLRQELADEQMRSDVYDANYQKGHQMVKALREALALFGNYETRFMKAMKAVPSPASTQSAPVPTTTPKAGGQKKCEKCHGAGEWGEYLANGDFIGSRCPDCHGTGVKDTRKEGKDVS